MPVQPGAAPPGEVAESPRRKDITWTWWLRTALTTLGSTA